MNTQQKKGKELITVIRIEATPDKVWCVLTDFSNYPAWNPFIKSLEGEPLTGKRIKVQLQPAGKKAMIFKPKVLVFDKAREFRWLGHFIFPGIFDGEHIFELKANDDGSTTFIQREKFNGLLVPLLASMIDKNTREGFEQMNRRLKELAEAL